MESEDPGKSCKFKVSLIFDRTKNFELPDEICKFGVSWIILENVLKFEISWKFVVDEIILGC